MRMPFPFVIWLWPLVVLGWFGDWVATWRTIGRAEIERAMMATVTMHLAVAALTRRNP